MPTISLTDSHHIISYYPKSTFWCLNPNFLHMLIDFSIVISQFWLVKSQFSTIFL